MVRALHPVKPQDILSVLLFFFMKHMTVNTGGIIRLYPRIIQYGKQRNGIIIVRGVITIELPVSGTGMVIPSPSS